MSAKAPAEYTAKDEFEAQVIETVKTSSQKMDEMVKDFGRLDQATKKSFEDLEKLKKHANDSQASLDATVRKIDQIGVMLKREHNMAYGNPVQRIESDTDKRQLFNALVRKHPFSLMGKSLPEPLQKTLDTANTPGSTYMLNELLRDIYDTLAMYGTAWPTFRNIRVGSKTVQVPVKTARPTAAYLTTEGGSLSDDSAKAGSTSNVTVKTMGVLLGVTNELLMDSEFDVTADVLADFAQALSYKMDWACTQADGGSDATDGGFTGIFGGGGTAATAADGNTTVETLDLEDFIRCLTTVDAGVLVRPCRWWIHPQIIARCLAIKDGNGRPVFLSAIDAPAYGGIGSILGSPVSAVQIAPSTNSASSKVAVFGDPTNLVHGIRQDFEFRSSEDYLFADNEVAFRGIARHMAKVRVATGYAVLTLAAS